MNRYWCEHAWLPDGLSSGVLLGVDNGRFTDVSTVDTPPGDAVRLAGVSFPGFANAHSHAFHRALRGRTAGGRGSFWTWREQMYALAAWLTPENYYALARGVYAEMALAGMTCVGEFHYVHRDADGRPYATVTAMSDALVAAAEDAGIRITLLDTCYLRGGFGAELAGVQRRFGGSDVQSWVDRVERFTAEPDRARLGVALHSVRAVPGDAIRPVTAFAAERDLPVHVHLSEQRAENEACLGAHGRTPTEFLAAHEVLGARTTAVHATHLAPGDTALLGGTRTGVCLCPTTEADLADGIGPALALAVAGSPLSLGSDGHSVIDPFAEANAVESYTRLDTETRGSFRTAEVLAMATEGHRALGWDDAGALASGARADLVTVAIDSPALAGVPPHEVFATARSADVRHVLVDGRLVVSDGEHRMIQDVTRTLATAIDTLWSPH